MDQTTDLFFRIAAVALSVMLVVGLVWFLSNELFSGSSRVIKDHDASSLDSNKRRKKDDDESWILVLDLDETLIRSHPPDFETYTIRPDMYAFLAAARNMFDEIVLFTAGTREYARPIVDELDPLAVLFDRCYYRDSCKTDIATGNVVKDLSIVGTRDLSRVIFVDNMVENFELQPECGLLVKSYYGESDDAELMSTVLPELARRRFRRQRDAMDVGH